MKNAKFAAFRFAKKEIKMGRGDIIKFIKLIASYY